MKYLFRDILPFMSDPAVTARFWVKVDRRGPDDCWPWLGEVNGNGYGRFAAKHCPQRIRLLAHRVATTLATGQEIGRLVLLHRCDNPICCNPAHHRPGTQADNMRDAIAKDRANLTGLDLAPTRNGPPKLRCKNGHPFDADNTRFRGGRRRCLTCERAAGHRARLRRGLTAEERTAIKRRRAVAA